MNSAHQNPDMELSVIVPVYNSSKTLKELTRRLDKAILDLGITDFELVYVNDGSKDDSWKVIRDLCRQYKRLKGVNLSRNYGQHNAIMCGFNRVKGRYVITLDDDLQNPPEEIGKLYDRIQDGFDVVYGRVKEKQHSRFRNLGSQFVRFIYKKTFKTKIDLSSFRILRLKIIKQIIRYNKSFTFIDGVIAWYTANMGMVDVRHSRRKEGQSNYTLKQLVILAVNMLTNFSIYPVQLTSMAGFFFSIIGFCSGFYFLIKKIFWGIPVTGYSSLIVAITIFSGVQLVTLGLLGEYIGRIHINVSNRPQYSVNETVSYKEASEDRVET